MEKRWMLDLPPSKSSVCFAGAGIVFNIDAVDTLIYNTYIVWQLELSSKHSLIIINNKKKIVVTCLCEELAAGTEEYY